MAAGVYPVKVIANNVISEVSATCNVTVITAIDGVSLQIPFASVGSPSQISVGIRNGSG